MNLRELLRHKFLRDTTTLQIGALINAGGNFLGAVGLSHLLGARGQGQFYVAVSLWSFLWFLVNLGLSAVTVSQVAAAQARGLHDKAAAWLAYLLKASLVLGALVAGGGMLALPWAAVEVLGADPEVGRFAAALAFTPLIELPRTVASASLQAARRMLPLAQIESSHEAVRVYLVLLGALLAGSAGGPVAGSLLASAFGSLLAIDLYRREGRVAGAGLPRLREILSHVRDVPLRQGLPLGLRVGAVRNLNALGVQILPSLFLQRFGSTEWVAYLRIAQRILNVPLLLMQAISRTSLPMFSELAGRGDLARMCRAYFRVSLYSGLLITAGVLLVLPLLPFLLDALFPSDYHAPVWTICLILVPGFAVMSFSIANDTFYILTDTLKVGILLCVLGAAVNMTAVGLLAWLYPTVGVAWGLTFSMVWSVLHLVYAAWWYRRHLRATRGAPRAAMAPQGRHP